MRQYENFNEANHHTSNVLYIRLFRAVEKFLLARKCKPDCYMASVDVVRMVTKWQSQVDRAFKNADRRLL